MMYATLLLASFVGLSLCNGGGDVFTMTPKEIGETKALNDGINRAVEELNMKNDRKENIFR